MILQSPIKTLIEVVLLIFRNMLRKSYSVCVWLVNC